MPETVNQMPARRSSAHNEEQTSIEMMVEQRGYGAAGEELEEDSYYNNRRKAPIG